MFHDGIQTDPLKNTASYAFMKMAEDLDIKGKFSISVEKGVPEGRRPACDTTVLHSEESHSREGRRI